ncbi:hypothetical protein [Arthrobacter sp. 24S4-2]|nr:hypothetical protein [Arthrobacter sp. 24S4-2]
MNTYYKNLPNSGDFVPAATTPQSRIRMLAGRLRLIVTLLTTRRA